MITPAVKNYIDPITKDWVIGVNGLMRKVDGSGEAIACAVAAIKHFTAEQAVAAAAAGVHADITGSDTEAVEVTTGITNPPCPRNLTVTPGGTTTDVAACTIVIDGTNEADEAISEDFAFLANASAATVGNKAFKTVTGISIPQQDGAAATFAIGFGDKLGLGFKLPRNTVQMAFLNDVKEGTAPTVAVSATALESNTADLNSALDGHAVDVYLMV